MANATTFLIEMRDTNLRFGDVTVPLGHGTSFWADKKNCEISVYASPAKDYQTTFKLCLENEQNMHACVQTLMKYTKMEPQLFLVKTIKPIIADVDDEKSEMDLPIADTKASIRFGFEDEQDREYFLRYALPALSGFTCKVTAKENNLYCATLTYCEAEPKPSQIQRINAVFTQIIGGLGIKEAVRNLRDERFPMKVKADYGAAHDYEWYTDHSRDYNVTKEKIEEQILMPEEEAVLLRLVNERDIEAWEENPAAFAESLRLLKKRSL